MNSETDFNPYILGIFCNWCAYAGADQAGTSRIQRPANLRILRVMCGGRVDSQMILEAFKKGVDGILISHCHPGDCHYVEGNYKTINKIPILKVYIKQFGINPNRLKLVFISASEGLKLTDYIINFVKELKMLGPNPIT
ncbi:MAG: hydrogenase iron-sulfur subunit, partial [Ignavibacteriales bacterium]|nr:hydrogenase iron-sulfur subunit [Ignavibacteriales bacterium]